MGYGKCPEFVCVDGLIVSKEQADWRGEEEEYMSSVIPFSTARGEKSATRAQREPGRGYGKCPEFVCVDRLIVGRSR